MMKDTGRPKKVKGEIRRKTPPNPPSDGIKRRETQQNRGGIIMGTGKVITVHQKRWGGLERGLPEGQQQTFPD